MKKTWFKSWFNTKYYHILYKNRDHKEAQGFIDKLVNRLILVNEKCLDLACGRGRHAVYLNGKGLNVVGVDLSEESIAFAKQFETEGLHFDVHDMRKVYQPNTFDVVFNLFTSFGYFHSEQENLEVLESIFTMLKTDGKLVIDFMNATKVINTLIPYEVKSVDDIDFHIRKKYTGSHILKNIQFNADNEAFDFTEKVQTLQKADFISLLDNSGFKIVDIYGDFDLSEFDEEKSDRLILIAEKK